MTPAIADTASTSSASTPRVLLLPDWRNAGPDHWLSHWQRAHGFVRVEQDDWHWPRRGDWMAQLEQAVLAAPTPALLVADGLGCLLVAAWAGHTRHAGQVAGALLVAPRDTDRLADDAPPQLFNWRPIERRRLPFASWLVSTGAAASASEGGADGTSTAFAAQLAADWGSQPADIAAPRPQAGPGALADAPGDGGWPQGLALLSSKRGRAV